MKKKKKKKTRGLRSTYKDRQCSATRQIKDIQTKVKVAMHKNQEPQLQITRAMQHILDEMFCSETRASPLTSK